MHHKSKHFTKIFDFWKVTQHVNFIFERFDEKLQKKYQKPLAKLLYIVYNI